MCVATNVAGESRRELNLEVLIPPQITASIESQIKHVDAESKDEILECPAQGYPKPRDRICSIRLKLIRYNIDLIKTSNKFFSIEIPHFGTNEFELVGSGSTSY